MYGKQSALSLVNEICNFNKLSPKRLSLFEHLQESNKSANLKPLCPTHWTVRATAVLSVISNYSVLLDELSEIGEHGTCDCSSKASGLCVTMEKFQTYLGLKLSHLVFVAVEQLATTLQSKDMSAEICIQAVKLATQFLQRQRSSSSFEVFYEGVCNNAVGLTDEPTLTRRRRPPKRFNDGTEGFNPETPKEYFRHQYYEALDILIAELNRRFMRKNLMVLEEIEHLLINACNNIMNKPSEQLISMYKSNIDFERLSIQLSMMPDLIKTVASDSVHICIKEGNYSKNHLRHYQ